MMRKTWSNVKILLKHHTTQCGVVLPHPHGDGVAAGVRGVYPTATPSLRLRRRLSSSENATSPGFRTASQ